MADLKAWCTKCKAETEHTWIAGSQCTCAVVGCGNWTDVPGSRKIAEAAREQRLAKTKAAAPETEAAPAETNPAQRETEQPKEKTMKPRITDDKIAEIRADYAALTEDQRTYEARKEIADKHGVSMPTFTKYTKLMERKTAKASKPGRKGPRVKASPSARPEGPARKAGGLKAALQAMVDAAVEVKVNRMLDALDLDAKVTTAVKAAFEEALK